MRRGLRTSFTLLVVSYFPNGFASPTLAQAVEAKPNNPCVEDQNIGPIDVSGAFSFQGSLDTRPDESDVDFFRFSTPSTLVVADHEGQGTAPVRSYFANLGSAVSSAGFSIIAAHRSEIFGTSWL